MKVELSRAEIDLILGMVEVRTKFIRGARTGESPRPFIALAKKLDGLLGEALCWHCRDGISRRKSGLCDPCHSYRERTGRLPTHDVLVRRAARA